MNIALLYKFFEGLTSERENRQIKTWLDASPDNKKRFFEERRLFDAIVLNSKEQHSRRVPESAKTIERPYFRISRHVRGAMRLTAAIILALVGSWYFFTYHNSGGPVAMQTINVPAGQRLNLVLPDGTNVWLNANTTIQYPITFNTRERLISINGQAYFDVAKNEKAPFIVKSPHGVVQALGTKFDVRDYSDEMGAFEATLMEGSVKVYLKNMESEQVILTSESKAYIDQGRLKTACVTDLSPYEWKEGLISFRNEAFKDIIKTFEKTYNTPILIENSAIANITYTGKFRITDGIEYALRVLQRTVDFTFKRDADEHRIYIR